MYTTSKNFSNANVVWGKYIYGLPMCVAHIHFSEQHTRSKWSMSAYIAMLCRSDAQCSVAVVTAQSHSSSNGIARAAYACFGAVHCGLVLGP